MVKHGYDGANTNRIAAEAGVSIGSLYQYFPSKEALVAALVEEHCERMWALTVERTASVAGQPLALAAREVIGALFAAHAVEPKLHKVLQEQLPRIGKLDRMCEINERSEQLVRAYLDSRGREVGVKDTELAAFVVVQIVEALAHGALDRPEWLLSGRLLDEATRVVVRYLEA